MRIIFILFTYLVSISAPAKDTTFRSIVVSEKLQKLVLGQSGPNEILKILGKPASVERKSQYTEVLFYNLNGVNYDTVLTVQNDKLIKIYQNHFKTNLKLVDLDSVLTAQQLQGAFIKATRVSGHAKGRSFIVEDLQKSFSAKFSAQKPYHLIEFEIWKEGDPKP